MANPIDDEVDFILSLKDESAEAEPSPALAVSMQRAAVANPDIEARKHQLARTLNTSPELLGADAEEQAWVTNNNAATIAAESPRTAQLLEDFSFSALAKDSIEYLGNIEKHWVNTGRTLASVPNRMAASFAGAAKGIVDLAAEPPPLEAARRRAGEAPFVRLEERVLGALSQELGEFAADRTARADAIAPDLSNAGPIQRGFQGGIQSAATAVPLMLGGLVTRRPEIIAGGFATLTLGDSYLEAEKVSESSGLDLTPTEKFNFAARDAAIEFIFEKAPSAILLKTMTGKTGLKEAAKSFLFKEIGGELATDATQDLNAWATLNPDGTFEQYLKERPESALETFVAAAVGGGAQLGAARGTRAVLERVGRTRVADEQGAAEAAVTAHDTLTAATAAAKAAPLRTRDEEAFKSAVEQLTSNPEQLQGVYVDVNRLRFALGEAGEPVDAVVGKLRDFEKNAAEALKTGTDIYIPTAEFLTHIAPTRAGTDILRFVRVHPGAKTAEEAQTFYTQRVQGAAPGVQPTEVLAEEEFNRLSTVDKSSLASTIPQRPAPVVSESVQPTVTVGPAVSERRSGARAEATDRRKDPARRRAVEEMGVEELRRSLLEDSMTGLGSRRAYEEAPAAPVVVSIDADSLKWINDNMLAASGDNLLSAVGKALKEATAAYPSIRAYHISGDEFIIQGDDTNILEAIMQDTNARLKKAKIRVEKPTGEILEKSGAEITYAFGENKDVADYNLKANKYAREARGLRAARGEKPAGVEQIAPPTKEVAGEETPTAGIGSLAGFGHPDYVPPPAGEFTYQDYLGQTEVGEGELLKTSLHKTLLVDYANSTAEKRKGESAEERYLSASILSGAFAELARRATAPLDTTYKKLRPNLAAQSDIRKASFSVDGLHTALIETRSLRDVLKQSSQLAIDLARWGSADAGIKSLADRLYTRAEVDENGWAALDDKQRSNAVAKLAEDVESTLITGKVLEADRPLIMYVISVAAKAHTAAMESGRGAMDSTLHHAFTIYDAAARGLAAAENDLGYDQLAHAGDRLRASESALLYMLRSAMQDLAFAGEPSGVKIVTDMRKRWDKKRDAMQELVREELVDAPVYQLRASISDGSLKFRPEEVSGLPTAPDGTPLDIIANAYGFTSDADMLAVLQNAPPLEAAIDAETQRRMAERYGNMGSAEDIKRLAESALAARGPVALAGELKRLTNSPMSVSEIVGIADRRAKELLSTKPINGVNPVLHMAAMSRHMRDARLATSAQGRATAIRNAMLDQALAKEAQDITSTADQHVKDALTLLEQELSTEGRAQAQAVAFRFGLSPINGETAKTLSAWADARARSLSAVAIPIPDIVLFTNVAKPYTQLTISELADIKEAISAITTIDQREHTTYIKTRNDGFKAARAAILDKIKQTHPKAGAVPEPIEHKPTIAEKLEAEFVSPEIEASILDGGVLGPVHEEIIQKLSDGVTAKQDMINGAIAALSPSLKAYSRADKLRLGRSVVARAAGKEFTKENIITLAMLYGNAEGRQRLAANGLTDGVINELFDQHLTDRDMDLISSAWSVFDNVLWPRLEALNLRTKGVAPPKVESLPFTVRGRRLSGGYFRLKYDALSAPTEPSIDDVETLMRGNVGMPPATPQGTSKERLDGVVRMPRLDFALLSETINETAHDIGLREAVADVYRMLKDPQIRKSISAARGRPVYDSLMHKLKETAAIPRDPFGFIAKTLNIARKNTMVVLLSGLYTAAQNVTGLVSSGSRVSAASLLRETMRFSANPVQAFEHATSQSGYLRSRVNHYDRDVSKNAKLIRLENQWGLSVSTALWFMSQVDKAVSTIVWNAAYRDAIAAGAKDPKANADHEVRTTQGSGRPLDASKIMGGTGEVGEIKAALTMLGSFFNGQLGALVRSGAVNKQRAKENPAAASLLFAKDFAFIVLLPAFITSQLAFRPGEEDEDEEAAAKRYAIEVAKYGAAMVPVVGRFASANLDYYAADATYRKFQLSPIESAVQRVVETPKSVADIISGEGTTADEKTAILGTSFVFRLPGSLLAKTWTGGQAALEGEEDPVKLIVHGAPSKPKTTPPVADLGG